MRLRIAIQTALLTAALALASAGAGTARAAGVVTMTPAAAQLYAYLATDPQTSRQAYDDLANIPIPARSALFALLGSGAYRAVPSFPAAFSVAAQNPNRVPAGANVPCALTRAHPFPVVLVHGTFEDMEDAFAAEAPILADNGYCVYTFNYGASAGALLQGTGPIPKSARYIAASIDAVRRLTGAARVDVVGHSEGGIDLEIVAKLLGRAAELDRLVAIAPATHGTTVPGLVMLAREIPMANAALIKGCAACVEQILGSPVLNQLDVPPIAADGPIYTIIQTVTDEVVPLSSAFIFEPGVTDESLQSFCPNDLAQHLEIDYDLVAIRLLLNALDPSRAQPPDCALAFPIPA